jgi:hypothetical protein
MRGPNRVRENPQILPQSALRLRSLPSTVPIRLVSLTI